jgi:hypothetical protein
MTEGISAREYPADHVHPWLAWCSLVGLSEATARRLRVRGEGPIVTQLSARRIGVRHRHHLAWLTSREQHQENAA